jgi:aminopeptidase N
MLASLALAALTPALAAPPLLAPDARGAAAPDRTFDMEALRLDLALDPEAGAVSGVATWTVRRLGAGPLVLDQVALVIADVRADDAPVPWRTVGDTLIVDVPGDHAAVAIRYRATPQNGLHFRRAASHGAGPDASPEVWSQGEAEDNRYWFPGWDHPNDRFAYTGAITAPAGWKVLTNSGPDLVNYLVMVAAGPYEVHGDDTISAWVPPGTTPEGVHRVLDPLPGMMAHLAARTGVPYAWGPYRQVFVQRFLYTGMENTSATIEDRSLVAGPSVSGTRRRGIESVVAHELSHQWYGDLLTSRSWRELWLNEGFATFFAADWQASVEGPEQWAAGVRGRYRASLATSALARRFHAGPDAPDNGNVYNKGASVLQMLRVMLGEDVFWDGIRRYTRAHAHSLVETDDLADAMEAASGQELGWFFEQWVELPYVPALTVTTRYADGVLVATITQATGPDRPRYTLPIAIEVGTPAGPVTAEGWLTDDAAELHVPLAAAPAYVAFDPRGGLLADVKQDQDTAAWEAQLASPAPYARLVAIEALGKTDHPAALGALAADVKAAFSLRQAAIVALGEQRAVAPLLPLLADPDDELRAAACDALGKGVDTRAVEGLRARVATDANPDVRAAALDAIAALDATAALKLARARLAPTGPDQERLVQAALRVVGEHAGAGDLDALLAATGPGRLRLAALRAAARLVEREDPGEARTRQASKVARATEPLLDDTDRRGREGAVALLAKVGDAATVGRLEAFRRAQTMPELRQSALDAVTAIQARAGVLPEATPNAVAARVEALEKRLEALEKEVEERR